MKALKFILVSAALFFMGAANAGTYTGNSKIIMMQNGMGGWLIKTETSSSNNPCSKQPILMEGSYPQIDSVYSLLLAAYLAGKPVNINVNDSCSSSGYRILSFVHTVW